MKNKFKMILSAAMLLIIPVTLASCADCGECDDKAYVECDGCKGETCEKCEGIGMVICEECAPEGAFVKECVDCGQIVNKNGKCAACNDTGIAVYVAAEDKVVCPGCKKNGQKDNCNFCIDRTERELCSECAQNGTKDDCRDCKRYYKAVNPWNKQNTTVYIVF